MILTTFMANTFPKYMNAYLATTLGFSFASRMYVVKDAETTRRNPITDRIETKPMLYRNRALIVLLGTAVGVEMWPFYLYRDIGKIELHLRGEPIEKPSKHAMFLDYIFCE